MFYDMSIDLEDVTLAEVQQSVQRAHQLGYRTVVLDRTIQAGSKGAVKEIGEITIPTGMHVLKRCTIISAPNDRSNRQAELALLSKKYDIIALRPTDETALHAACSSIETIDIISVDLSTRLPFYFKHGSIGLAIERGIFFEICYSGAIRDPSSRRQLISNAQGLVRATRGRQIILSGGASRAIDLRGPHDIINLASLFAMSPDRARDALTVAPRKAIKHAEARRTAVKSTIIVVPPVETAEGKKRKRV